LISNIKEKFIRIYINCDLFEKKMQKSRASLLTSGCYLAHPLSFSRQVGPKDLKSCYSQFSCLIFSIKRMLWSSGVARNYQWGLEVLGRRPQKPPTARSSGANPQL